MRIIKAKDYRDLSRKAANIISAQIILKPGKRLQVKMDKKSVVENPNNGYNIGKETNMDF